MPTPQQLRERLLKKLSELFQLDQPDLDFGFYRIMHTKAQEVQDFIGTDLLKIVADAFGKVAPFAVPYNGEEVKLHWANADQYYILIEEEFMKRMWDVEGA